MLTIVTLSFATVVHAENTTSTTTESTDSSRSEQVQTRRAELQQKLQELKAQNKTRLNDARKKVCETRQDKINGIIQKRSEQGTKHLDVFKKIADRVQEFVKTKDLTIENYDDLVAAINDKETAVQAAIDSNSAVTFECATAVGDHPGEVPRASIDAVRDALKDYRTVIKDLIVNVKASAASTTSADAASTTNGEVDQ